MSSSKRAVSPSAYRKACDLCETPCNVLVRCRIDESQQWRFVCTSECWTQVSGGQIDGPGKPYYTYGGMWKNKHAGVSAKKSKCKEKAAPASQWTDLEWRYVTNDRVSHERKVWACRRSHQSDKDKAPSKSYTFWKEIEIL